MYPNPHLIERLQRQQAAEVECQARRPWQPPRPGQRRLLASLAAVALGLSAAAWLLLAAA